jgi:Rod binding domain-containing protein
MIRPVSPAEFKPAGPAADNDRLRDAAKGMEAVFFGELMKAMRETVPEGGELQAGAGEQIFTGLFDERISELAAARQHGGLGDALYRQLARLLESRNPVADGEAK